MMTVTLEEYDRMSLEDKLVYTLRISRGMTSIERDLMEDASEEIIRLRQEIEELDSSLYDAGERLMGEDI